MTAQETSPVPVVRAAVTFFHEQLDEPIEDHTPAGTHLERPTTARAYFEEVRGWSTATIDQKQLGWAPPEGGLVAYLRARGFDDAAIRATGFVTEGLQPLWRGRYVFPYFVEGNPVYAIARATGPKGGGAAGYDGHPADYLAGKYTKAAKTKDYVRVEEPIYGQDTLARAGPVLITEGIADAITAHEAGYACISPVTTKFKAEHAEALPALLDEDRRIVIVQDAEPPSNDLVEADPPHLSLTQYGPGVRGAVATGVRLEQQGFDVRLGELPRPDRKKVDLDDFIQEWDALDAVLRSAKPPSQHPAAADQESPSDDQREMSSSPVEALGRSALTDLTLPEVVPVDVGYRGPNPLGHHGESENYFALTETSDGYLAYDHKYDVAYSPLTYLLCAQGARRPSDPNGSLTDRELFLAWAYAKREGIIHEADPVPYAALRAVALKRDLIDEDALRDGWGLSADAYNAALAEIETELDLEPGRKPVESTYEVLAEVTSFQDWRDARHEATIPQDEAHARVQAAIKRALTGEEYNTNVLIDALPSTGKSYGTVAAVAATTVPTAILVGRGREEMYDQYREWAHQHDLSIYRLPAIEDCPVARGDHGDEQRDLVWQPYHRGAGAKAIHDYWGDGLACQREGTCPYLARWEFDPAEYDILLGHYVHAYLPPVVANRAVIIDEFPGNAYEAELDADTLAQAVSTLLDEFDWTGFQAARHREAVKGRLLTKYLDLDGTPDVEPDTDLAFDHCGHANGPIAVASLLLGENLGNGFEWSQIGTTRAVFNREQSTWHALQPPDALQYARAVIGLDGTPTKVMWDLALGRQLDYWQVLEDDERRDYLKNTLSHDYVRTTRSVKPPGSDGQYVNVDEDVALFNWVADQHTVEPALVTALKAKQKYEQAPEFSIDDVLYYGNLLGSNEFASRSVGIVSCSQHYGDGFIKKWGAYLGEPIERIERDGQQTRGTNLAYTGFGDDILKHMREHQTLQAVLRFGRGGQGARIYVHTNTLPEWVGIDAEVTVSTFGAKQREILQAILAQDGSFSRRDLDVSASASWTNNFLGTLVEQGYLEREKQRGRYTYQVVDDPPGRGLVDFEFSESTDRPEGRLNTAEAEVFE